MATRANSTRSAAWGDFVANATLAKKMAAKSQPLATKHLLDGSHPTKKPKTSLSESKVQAACIDLLDKHPNVVKWWRQNTGSAKMGGRFVKFSFKGASDLMGVLRGGRFLAVEVKATGKAPSLEQIAFLDAVNAAGGLAVCVDDPVQLANTLRGV